ncbi:WD40 repeat-like protein [Sparassis latifolia]|uniref:WD repeat-containing protein n=1 Tax=Sparassis crispa TaxID=139825 RepID=A0A401GXG9_9APHY|nr:WD repeat-containing protein [Sparassis crispa]GBE86925.1 WD repeat-containing protein [Sparassis crispa]
MDGAPAQSCVTPPRRKRTWTPGSITNAYSTKRRRISMTTVELAKEISSQVESRTPGHTTVADRFITARPKFAMPFNITPRSQRIGRQFGMAEDRMLKFTEAKSSGTEDIGLRANFSQLLTTPPKISPTSAAMHLGSRKQFILALDGPGIPSDPFAFPLSWSARNAIAVACGRDVYYQNLDTRSISHLCTLTQRRRGRLASIEWANTKPHLLGLGTTTGCVQLWDVDSKTVLREWEDEGWGQVGGMGWNGDVLAVGTHHGDIVLYDVREEHEVSRVSTHRGGVLGVRWSHDGNYMASGDDRGVVHFWDARAGKALTNENKLGSKMKHQGPVKALAWCPWKPDLLATGSTYSDGRIRIYSVHSTAPAAEPLHTLSLNTSVTSLIWSPHCKELLSTHGTSWQPRASSMSTLSSISAHFRPVPVKGPLTNSLTVHSYPSMRRVVSVPAHSGAVGHSCLGPDGTLVFTICPAEEAMKMWKVWGVSENVQPRESVFDKCSIR